MNKKKKNELHPAPVKEEKNKVINQNRHDIDKQLIAIVLENYATKMVDLSGLSNEDKTKKENDLGQAAKALADSLGAEGLLQNMLVTQLLSTHDLHQKLLPYASRSMNYPEDNQYFINAITKLSNTFIQQITMLQKLQGQSQQKVVVEHLHIHEGAQAIVGQVNTHTREGVSNEK